MGCTQSRDCKRKISEIILYPEAIALSCHEAVIGGLINIDDLINAHIGKLLLERSLSEMQENICKILIAFPEGTDLPDGLNILHKSSTGRLQTLIVRGKQEELTDYLNLAKPLFMDAVPLTLEEIFIYELGGVDYEVKDIIV